MSPTEAYERQTGEQDLAQAGSPDVMAQVEPGIHPLQFVPGRQGCQQQGAGGSRGSMQCDGDGGGTW